MTKQIKMILCDSYCEFGKQSTLKTSGVIFNRLVQSIMSNQKIGEARLFYSDDCGLFCALVTGHGCIQNAIHSLVTMMIRS